MAWDYADVYVNPNKASSGAFVIVSKYFGESLSNFSSGFG